MINKIYSHFMHNSLYRNSIYLMTSSLFTAFFGFIFWILNTHLFTTRDIGIATAIITSAGFIGDFSLLGLKNGLIRYLPKSETKNNKINTTFTVVTVTVVILSILFVIATPWFSEKLTFLKNNYLYALLFIVFLASFSLNQIQEGIFIAYRSSGYILVKNVLWGLTKIALPVSLVGFGAMGVFSAFSTGSVISLLLGIYILWKKFGFKAKLTIDKHTLQTLGRFSAGDYLGIFFGNIPSFVLPLFVINRLGPEEGAFYYVAMQVAGFLFMIPSAVNQSLFAEGSHSETELKTHLVNSIKFSFLILIPAIIITVLFGKYVLQIFGKHYSENAVELLQILAFAGIFMTINQVGSALVHIQKKIYIYVFLNLLGTIAIIILSHFLLGLGLIGVGISLTGGYALIAVIYAFVLIASLR